MKNKLILLTLIIVVQLSQLLQASSSSAESQQITKYPRIEPHLASKINKLPENVQSHIFSILLGEHVQLKNVRSYLVLNKLINTPWILYPKIVDGKWFNGPWNSNHEEEYLKTGFCGLSYPETLLHKAVMYHNVHKVKLLLSAGANPNITSPGYETRPTYHGSKETKKWSVYALAVDNAEDTQEGNAKSRTESHEIAKLLLKYGAEEIAELKPLPSKKEMDDTFNNPGW